MRSLNRNLLVPVMILAASVAARAQEPDYSGIGRTATQEEIRAWDITIGPEGRELPPGSGTAVEGAKLFVQKGCVVCHGPTGQEAKFMYGRLVGGQGTLTTDYPTITPGSTWPYATTIWDFIRRAMPEYPAGPNALPEGYLFATDQVDAMKEGWMASGPFGMQDGELLRTGVNPLLTIDEIYSLTAFVLYKNGIIKETDVMDRQTLPKVRMPNRNGFIPVGADGKVPVWKPRDPLTRIDPHVSPNSKPRAKTP